MWRGFEVVRGIQLAQPGAEFVKQLRSRVREVLRREGRTAADTWILCEYADLMDSGAIPARPRLRKALARTISDFLLSRATPQEVVRFNSASFAAEDHGVLPHPSLTLRRHLAKSRAAQGKAEATPA